MPTRVLSLQNLKAVPFADAVRQQIADGLAPLVDSGDLRLDFTGASSGKADYRLEFDTASYGWNVSNKTGCWFHPSFQGVSGTVTVDALTRRNYCIDLDRCQTCEAVFRRSPAELGRAIGDTALHEIGHLFGLTDAESYNGADSDGHTGEPRNPMFSDLLHKDFLPLHEDWKRSTKYTIVGGDTLSAIARRAALWRPPPHGGWPALLEFKGQDGQRNRDLLRSKDPSRIEPGEQIWIPDLRARLLFMRSINLETKAFTKAQFDRMRTWIRAGRSIFE